MSKKSPQLRFEGFTDDWEERKFKDILKTHSFRSYLADVSNNGEYEIIQQGDNPIVGYSDGKPFTNYKDVTLFGDHTVSLYKPHSPFFVATDGIKILSADNFDGDYLYTTLERYKPSSQGYKRHFTILKNHDVWFTGNIEEQQKIGLFFSQLDNTIALHQRKLDLLKEQKKGFLQKMFPKNGETVPEIRFEGFTDAWEERKLEELGNLNRGKSKHRPRNDSRLFGGEYPFIQTGDVAKAPLFLAEYSQTYSEFGIQQSKLWDIGTLLITIAANIADTTILGIKAAFPDSVIGFESTSCDVVFIKNYIDIQSDLLKRKAETSSQANLNLAKLKELNLNVPKLKEQQKIGSFFKQLDDTIALHQRKLDLLKEQKKGFLQKMFV